MTEGEIITSG